MITSGKIITNILLGICSIARASNCNGYITAFVLILKLNLHKKFLTAKGHLKIQYRWLFLIISSRDPKCVEEVELDNIQLVCGHF